MSLQRTEGINYSRRQERVFLVLAGFFICAMTMLNIIGITRFIELGPLVLAVGVLPYPLTFLCTDLVSELYGRNRANFLVTVGLVLNGFILLIMYLGQLLPSAPEAQQPPWQNIPLADAVSLPDGTQAEGSVELFSLLYKTTTGSIVASMVAYVTAQYCDIQLFHFWKRLTKGKHLWLRNNMSTLISQAVDSIMVISVTFAAAFVAGNIGLMTMLGMMLSNYLFKLCAALLDTGPLYYLVYKLRPYLRLDEIEEGRP